MSRRPIRDAIIEYDESKPARFHMPGHKGALSSFDVTEIGPTDDLQSPNGPILKSERLCAEVYSARDAFYLVNGSTTGNLAMMRLIGRGNRVLLDRGCHKSVIAGAALCGVDTVSIFPGPDGMYTPEQIASALDETPCKAVFLTSPTYRGMVDDVFSIAKVVHERGAVLMVDSAHGAHFPFSDEFPPLPYSADMYCVSTHKTLFAMTQSAVLFANRTCPYTRGEIQQAVNMFQSTSPSFELMLSIEEAVLCPRSYRDHFQRLERFKKALRAISGVSLLGSENVYITDKTRLNISLAGMNGRSLKEVFEKRGIYPEMADGECVTLITTPYDEDEWYVRAIYAVEAAAAACGPDTLPQEPDNAMIKGEYRMSIRDAVFANKKHVPLEDAAGYVASDPAGVYPPGVATLFPGELISDEAVKKLITLRSRGAELFGVTEGKVAVVSEEPVDE